MSGNWHSRRVNVFTSREFNFSHEFGGKSVLGEGRQQGPKSLFDPEAVAGHNEKSPRSVTSHRAGGVVLERLAVIRRRHVHHVAVGEVGRGGGRGAAVQGQEETRAGHVGGGVIGLDVAE